MTTLSEIRAEIRSYHTAIWNAHMSGRLIPASTHEELARLEAAARAMERPAMRLYFSGVASAKECAMLVSAGVRHYLADREDLPNLPDDRDSYAVDSGAYRAWKAGKELDVQEWLAWLSDHFNRWGTPDFVVMPDILGDPARTWDRWLRLVDVGANCAPVWQWGAPREHLDRMCERADTVCVGGLVPHMRDRNEQVLEEVKAIAQDYGRKLHILGLNWLHALAVLKPLVKSCDTSKWLDGARYGETFLLGPDGELHASHKHHCGMSLATREELCISCAVALRKWVDDELKADAPKRATRTYVLDAVPRVYEKGTDRTEAQNNWQSFLFKQESERRHERAKAFYEGKPWSKK